MKVILKRRLRGALRAFKVPESYEKAAYDDRRERERLAARAASGERLKLHLGCGPRVLAGWVNIDLAYQPGGTADQGDPEPGGSREEFFAIDVTRGLPLPDDCVDVVFHEDFLEHLSQRDAVGFLAEARRVMVDGAVHRVNTPDLAASMRRHSDFSRGLRHVHPRVGSLASPQHLHAALSRGDRAARGL